MTNPESVASAKHTPGPWHPPHMADDTTTCNCESVVSDHYAGAIARICIDNGLPVGHGGNDSPPLEEAKANARLIAAAPDLLAALKMLHDDIAEYQRINHLGGYENHAMQAARAAMAKAEGR